jgi:hypothetical protein
MNYAKGEWKAIKPAGSNGYWDVVTQREEAATCYGRNAEANARLIAAAPELYEALIKLQQLKVFHSHSPIGVGKEANAWKQVRKALAKAEGKDGK